ncbi:ABC transporter substrate-binding protein [Nocardioides mangrovicus]|uniref:ABC transporter substrate-binding protein n=1 Tax=Nocardioides mangrovicus TaxID=2478913 RepID=UPI001E5B8181|nr:extracellular solute-binding protein [Nocardioides mangrovicus]
MRRSTRLCLAVLLTALTLLAAGCGGGSADGPVKLTFWTWAPNMDKVVAVWNEKHPDIQVTVNKQDGGDPAVTKLLTAVKAGKGAPDIMQAEYQKIPTLVSAGALADISKDVPTSATGQFGTAELRAVDLGSKALYAVPQDTGPLAFFYRADVFQRLGIAVPTTWQQYAAAARQIHQADPTMYLGTFSANDAGWFAGLAQQAGASWWATKGQTWSVDIDSAATRKVADFWGGLVQEGVIDNKPMYTPAWNAALNDGKQVGWVSAVWAPGVLEGNAAKTKGLWQMAPLPQWGSTFTDGAWGGSATGVTTQSQHPEQAAQFATWLNTDPAALKALVSDAGIYPAAKSAQLTTPPAFFSNQSDFYEVAAKGRDAISPFTYGPNVNAAYNAYNDAFGQAADAKTQSAFGQALTQMQSTTLSNLKSSGFTTSQ